MAPSGLFTDVLVFLVAAVAIVPLFHRLRASPILGYLAAGMLIGPHGFSIIGDTHSADTLAEFGVVFLLFMIGLDLSLERLHKMRHYVFGLGLLQVVVTTAIVTGIGFGMGIDIKAAILIGGALALSSTAFVLQLLKERGERATTFGIVTFSVLLLQDLAVVPLLMLMTTLSQEGTSFVAAFGLAILQAMVALVVAIWAGRIIFRPVFHVIASARSSELFVAMALLSILGMGWMLSLTGLSMALGAFLAGLLLAETEYKHQVEADIKPFRGLLLGLFFMTIGMSIDIVLIVSNLPVISLLVLALLLGKTIVTALLARMFGLPTSTSLQLGIALAQGGEFGFVLLGASGALGLIPMDIVQILLAVIALSMAVTPVLTQFGAKLANRLRSSGDISTVDIASEVKGLEGHVLIAGFGRVGQTIAKVLGDGGIPYVAVDNNTDRVSECRRKGAPVYYGDASQVSVLKSAGAEFAAAIVITLDQISVVNQLVGSLRRHYPEMKIFVRARDMRHLHLLETEGATSIVPETAEASLQLGAIVISALGASADTTESIVQNYRENDYALLEDIVGR